MILDLIIVLIIILFALIGTKQGISRLLLGIASSLASIIITIILLEPLKTLFVERNFLYINSTITNSIYHNINQKISSLELDIESLTYREILAGVNIPLSSLLDRFIIKNPEYTKLENICKTFSFYIITISLTTIVFLTFWLTLRLLKKKTKEWNSENKGFAAFDCTLGLFAYSMIAILIIIISLSLIKIIPLLNSWFETKALDTSVLGSYLYTKNFIASLFNFIMRFFR